MLARANIQLLTARAHSFRPCFATSKMADARPPPTGAETWDSRYKPPRFAYGTEPNVFIEAAATRHLPQGSNQEVAELASGEGRNVVFLAGTLGHRVHAVDFSAVGLEKTMSLAAQQGCEPSLITCHCADVVTWQPPTGPASLDAVIMSFCHIAQADKPSFFHNLISILKPGGLLLLETFRPEQISKGYREKSGGPPDPTMMYTVTELRQVLGASGQELEADEVEYELKEGPLHDGIGAVVRYVWKKAA